MSWATEQELDDFIDECATEDPLWALREIPQYLSQYRLDACATLEPAAALIHAYHLLTPERREACAAAAREIDLKRYIPDRLHRERREALRRPEGRS